MKGIIKVVTAEEFILWKAKQVSNYTLVMKDKLPAAQLQIRLRRLTVTTPAKLIASK